MSEHVGCPCDRCRSTPPQMCPTCNGDGECHGAHDVIVGECGDCDGTGRYPSVTDEP